MADGSPQCSLDEWAETLARQLKQREDEYGLLQEGGRRASEDSEVCRVLALKSVTFALLEVVGSLKALPQFEANRGLWPLMDLTAALADLTAGRRPRMLERAAGIGTGSDGVGKFNLKKHAAIAVMLLEETGMSGTAARKRVASVLSNAGLSGRKGGPLSPGTLFDWIEECRSTPAWREMCDFVRDWADDKADPLSEDSTVRWIKAFGVASLRRSEI